MRNSHRTCCGKCHKEFADVWALKRHYADCLRPEAPATPLRRRDAVS